MIYLIHGVWFQKQTKIGIKLDTVVGEVATLQTAQYSSMYMGCFAPFPGVPVKLMGTMVDHAGESDIVDIQLTEDTLSFSKLYLHRQDCIDYTFKKQSDGTWEGEYVGSSPLVGRGKSRCILTAVPDDFLTRNT